MSADFASTTSAGAHRADGDHHLDLVGLPALERKLGGQVRRPINPDLDLAARAGWVVPTERLLTQVWGRE